MTDKITHQRPSGVEWQDLRALTTTQVAYNLILPYPFLLMSWWFASQAGFDSLAHFSYLAMACLCSYAFFASAFRQAHDGFHHSLGIGSTGIRWLLVWLSPLLLTSLHSTRATHLMHHRDTLGEQDIEGSLANKSWWQALMYGIAYKGILYRYGITLSNPSQRQYIRLESILIVGFIMFAITLAVTGVTSVLLYHLAVMLLANSLMGLIAIWSVHHDCNECDELDSHNRQASIGVIARTERNRLVNLLTFNLLFHVEHHLYPAVPSNHLPELAKRLDKVAPEMTRLTVIPNKTQDRQNDTSTCPIRRRFA